MWSHGLSSFDQTHVASSTNNFDVTLFKNIALGSSGLRKLQLRWEIYNVFNRTQFATVDAVAGFGGWGRSGG